MFVVLVPTVLYGADGQIILVLEAYRQPLQVQRISLLLVKPKRFCIVGCQLTNVEHLARKVNISIL